MANKASLELQSIERISNLPLICSTLSLTTEYYERIKESNNTSRMLLALAEHSVQKAALLVVEPMAATLEKPIKLADAMVCSTMDFVENRLALAGDTPQKISSVITSLPVQPAVECAIAVASYGVQKINHIYSKINGENSQPEDERDTEPVDKCDRGTQTLMVGNVRDKVILYSQK